MDTTFLNVLGLEDTNAGTYFGASRLDSNQYIESFSPVDGKSIGKVSITSPEEFNHVIEIARVAFEDWRKWPAPQRGEIIRQFGNVLRDRKVELGHLVSYEMGKSLQEGLGEVQEMIDICDFAVGLSRQLYGLAMHSERPNHRMYEQWHPLGIIGVITAFNFPVAVWAWNAMIALVCGDSVVWKPSEKAPLCAIACQKLLAAVLDSNNCPPGISCLINGDYNIGSLLTKDVRVPLISATGSCGMGKKVGAAVAERLGRSLLELGGNNAMIITPDADLQLVLRAALFGAVGTTGQRCTSTRRLIVHSDVLEAVCTQLQRAYQQLRIGNPLDSRNHLGPLIDRISVANYMDVLDRVKEEGGSFIVEGEILTGEGFESGCFASPSIAMVSKDSAVVKEETFAPLLYIIKYDTLDEAISIQNNVPQGLSSAIMTNNLREAEIFLSASGSDCGIANVNIGTSGAEIGGAFGGEKDTGGGRESGSDSWKAYMRRQTNTINYGGDLPLAQGIQFDL
ncbi:MAG: aldehyde dehydrogenase family protein [Saprospiraceae bacterium]|nr:aldehyde dehydrogenase family protein [Saprospiraceae bacterium]